MVIKGTNYGKVKKKYDQLWRAYCRANCGEMF